MQLLEARDFMSSQIPIHVSEETSSVRRSVEDVLQYKMEHLGLEATSLEAALRNKFVAAERVCSLAARQLRQAREQINEAITPAARFPSVTPRIDELEELYGIASKSAADCLPLAAALSNLRREAGASEDALAVAKEALLNAARRHCADTTHSLAASKRVSAAIEKAVALFEAPATTHQDAAHRRTDKQRAKVLRRMRELLHTAHTTASLASQCVQTAETAVGWVTEDWSGELTLILQVDGRKVRDGHNQVLLATRTLEPLRDGEASGIDSIVLYNGTSSHHCSPLIFLGDEDRGKMDLSFRPTLLELRRLVSEGFVFKDRHIAVHLKICCDLKCLVIVSPGNYSLRLTF